MSKLYQQPHRELQDEFDTRNIADRLEQISSDVVDPMQKHFIEQRDMFFLASVNAEGSPTVSYKGGDPGFVQVLDEKTLIFPSYDGNGMYLSMGNISASAEVGLLFIDFQKPNRLRVQGKAELCRDEALLARYKEAQLVVKVNVTSVFTNCPRYIHRHEKVEASRYVPREDQVTPFATWKRVDIMQDALNEKDSAQVEDAGGVLAAEDWVGKVVRGDPEA